VVGFVALFAMVFACYKRGAKSEGSAPAPAVKEPKPAPAARTVQSAVSLDELDYEMPDPLVLSKQFDATSTTSLYFAAIDTLEETGVLNPNALSGDAAIRRRLPPKLSRANITLISKLGNGAFGDVWKAELDEFSESGRPGYLVAVKMVQQGAPEIERLELMKEAAIMSHLSGEDGGHPNVLSLVGLVDDGAGETFVVIAYCEYGSLDKYLEKYGPAGTINESFRIGLGRQVAGAMAFIAGRGMVHRDLAARNVLLDSRLAPRVCDFGLARRDSRHSQLAYEGAAATPYAVYELNENSVFRFPVRWTAPEVFAGQRYTTSADVWSFAMLMIEIFTDGRVPFAGTPQSEVFGAVVSGTRPEKPMLCPDSVYEVLRQCWTSKSSLRPPFAIIQRQLEGLEERALKTFC
jgi:serine/threonine protein kinase